MLLTASEIRRKLREVDETITKIKKQQTQIDKLVVMKVDEVIGEKLEALQIGTDTATFKQENAPFVASLKTMLKGQLETYFRESLVALEVAKIRLLAIL